jgi:hypothetical protein
MVQAALEGAVDYTKADRRDPNWYRKLRLILEGINRRNNLDITRLSYEKTLAVLGNSRLTDDSFKEAQQSAQTTFRRLIGLYRPWEGQDEDEQRRREFADYRQRYINAFGMDPYDPEFKRWEAGQIAKMREQDRAARQGRSADDHR